MQQWVQAVSADIRTLDRRYRVPVDLGAEHQRTQVYTNWLKRLAECDFESLDRVSQTDYLLLRSELEYRLAKQQLDQTRDEQAIALLPYWSGLTGFCKAREDVERLDAARLAGELNALAEQAEQAARSVGAVSEQAVAQTNELGASNQDGSQQVKNDSAINARLTALRATELLEVAERTLREADSFYRGYDPQYAWWVTQPMERLQKGLKEHRHGLRNKIVGVPEADQDTILGLPIGSEGLALELTHEWIAHSPSELVELAKREMAWCDEQMAAASAELGFGDDWRAAMAAVKSKHVAPGEQPAMIRDLAWEAIRFLEANDLVTVPPLAANGWRMTMMSPERQRVNPYFLGGESIIVSFPTDAMTHDEKLMSMRSNNEHFSRATVHHELIPGHHLQYYMQQRYRPYRSLFSTPFWIEGWALYWEMLLWDLDFAQGPEDRVGMLFWRKHRCARIIFSLSYHLGTMTPEECISYLVERVGHERSAASAEVRRSIMGGYSPLYQAAYMLGGLQLRKLHTEMVQLGQMTNRQFHDAVLHEHSIPIEVLRNYFSGVELSPDMQPSWRFAE